MKVFLDYTKDLHFKASVREFKGLDVDEPVSFHGTNLGPSAVEYLLIGIGGCLGTTFLYCLQKKTGELMWKTPAKSVISTSPLIANNIVFWGSLDHFYYAADITNGQILWQYETKGRIRTTPVVWDEYFIGASEDNYLYAFKSQ